MVTYFVTKYSKFFIGYRMMFQIGVGWVSTDISGIWHEAKSCWLYIAGKSCMWLAQNNNVQVPVQTFLAVGYFASNQFCHRNVTCSSFSPSAGHFVVVSSVNFPRCLIICRCCRVVSVTVSRANGPGFRSETRRIDSVIYPFRLGKMTSCY